MIFVLSGNYLGRLIDKRIEALNSAVLLIKEIKTRINYQKISLYEIINDILSEGPYRQFSELKKTELYVSDGMSFSDSWSKCVDESAELRVLKNDERALLKSFAKQLGASDMEGQNENFDTYIELISQKAKLLEKDRLNRVKLCNSIGLLLGITTFILFY